MSETVQPFMFKPESDNDGETQEVTGLELVMSPTWEEARCSPYQQFVVVLKRRIL